VGQPQVRPVRRAYGRHQVALHVYGPKEALLRGVVPLQATAPPQARLRQMQLKQLLPTSELKKKTGRPYPQFLFCIKKYPTH